MHFVSAGKASSCSPSQAPRGAGYAGYCVPHGEAAKRVFAEIPSLRTICEAGLGRFLRLHLPDVAPTTAETLPRIQTGEGGKVLPDLWWLQPLAGIITVINTVHTELHSNFNFMLLWRILFKVMFKNNLCKLPKNRSSNVTFLDR